MRRIVIIGATGFFGRRLTRRLAGIDGVELVLTSRSEERARALAHELHGVAKITAIAFDRDDTASLARLSALAPWLVIDASGPFQGASYNIARVAIGLDAHWIDLADARDYLLGFGAALDAAARAKGVVARAGASSTPALSMAVAEELTRGWRRVDTIDIAILPGGKGDVGEAVIRAILSYSGAPISSFAEGRASTLTGWGSAHRLRVDGLGIRYVSPVETADAVLMPKRFGVTSRVSFSAGLESRVEQFGLLALAFLRRRGLIANLQPLAPMLMRARAITRPFASDRGGMTVDCAGLDENGRPVSARWTLLAQPAQGPDVPVLPAVALTRQLIAGDVSSGASIASLPLSAIEAEMKAPKLVASRTKTDMSVPSLLERALGASYAALPVALRAFHDRDAMRVWQGRADIDASASLSGGLLRSIFGFPPSGRDVPVTVSIDRSGNGETWTRNFAGRIFSSRLSHEGGNIVAERFGAFRILLGLKAGSGEIEMPVVGWRLGPMPLPLFLAPKSETREFADDRGRFRFDVAIRLPVVGLLAHYRGWLEPKAVAAREEEASA